ncbi:unnamed protein product [Linum tenue]|uniref:Uncharacterized protein n=1 Tax=Linum tenue TaxID=586396 RepID=A0AAV0JK26_9ROSI|nr:unnamed protein product [Linum tenue]
MEGKVLRFATIVSLLLLVALVGATIANAYSNAKVFDVRRYGAKPDGKSDSSEAFLAAWNDACKYEGKARVVVPPGEFVTDAIMFLGPCKGSMGFIMKGRLSPPDRLSDPAKWITFRYVNGLMVSGHGTFDGRSYADPSPKPSAMQSLRFDFINDGVISHIRSVNSRNAHMQIYGCNKIRMHNILVKAPGNSKNTDGIKIGASTDVHVTNSVIGTGDDCIAILGKSSDIHVSQVFCGPGHGISIGSMGYYPNNENNDVVTGVTVTDCTFRGTTDGVRIKTWATPYAGLVQNLTFSNIHLDSVDNPIIIDQEYCPKPPCNQVPSHIRIEDVTYDNVWGTSRSAVAVKLNCSKMYGCKGLVLKDINMIQKNGLDATSFCSNAVGATHGVQKPSPCL